MNLTRIQIKFIPLLRQTVTKNKEIYHIQNNLMILIYYLIN